ncbi:MAG: hypothetical protein HC902_14655, partial [Calothrix sp. SM1_5_4]|nr:hypothetical protein [Calothrix sp. SM1_5_4]
MNHRPIKLPPCPSQFETAGNETCWTLSLVRIRLTALFSLYLAPSLYCWGQQLPALRGGIDIYNSVGSSTRLIAFMKMGAHPSDQRYLVDLNARINAAPLPRALMSGSSVYFRGVDDPLRVLDLRQRLFTFRGTRLDFRAPGRLTPKLQALENALGPTSRPTAFSLLRLDFSPSPTRPRRARQRRA